MNLHEALIHIRDTGPTTKREGICINASTLTGYDCIDIICDLALHWPDHSGDIVFPVIGLDDYFLHKEEDGDLWDRSTERGRLRWDLLHYLIEKTTPEKPQTGEMK